MSEWKDTHLIDITETMVANHYRKVTKKAAIIGTNAFKKFRVVFDFAMDHYQIKGGKGSEPIPVYTHYPVFDRYRSDTTISSTGSFPFHR
ncbi:MAG: hypothetical protein QNK37_13060 [Acidobacteriota bacterium]|nr:hypothetical protein [Acidobacteriota bacterium]